MAQTDWSIGSTWARWDPHIHAPGTLRNDQFGGDWDGYIKRIQAADPAPAALGVTDYFTLRGYKAVLERRDDPVLCKIPLIFPNVEIRLSTETRRGGAINLHLLISPDDPDHVEKIEYRLGKLEFRYDGEGYPCNDKGLVALGRAFKRTPTLEVEAALCEGANQFKVEPGKLRELCETDPWFRDNVLIAVALGEDGLGGLSRDASFRAHREELARLSHIMFSGNPKDREYWLGRHLEFDHAYEAPKPCLHGCDAHSLEEVLEPDQNRRCWIRAEPSFEGLRQTLAEPDRRVHIGEAPPSQRHPGETIRSIKVANAPWFANGTIRLNEGLVTVIGAKGSGKTALADLIAFGAGADDQPRGSASFLSKADPLLWGAEIELEWDYGSQHPAKYPAAADTDSEPRVRYLSQHSVERLCSPVGLADVLVSEIEGVVFKAIPEEARLECTSFKELRALKLKRSLMTKMSFRETIEHRTRTIAHEMELERSIPRLQEKLKEARRANKATQDAIAQLPAGQDGAAKKAQAISNDLSRLRSAIAAEEKKAQNLADLVQELRRQEKVAENALEDLKGTYRGLIPDEKWQELRLKLPEGAVESLEQLERAARERASDLKNRGQRPDSTGADSAGGPDAPLAPPQGLHALEQAHKASMEELGQRRASARRLTELNARLAKNRAVEAELQKEVANAQGAPTRRQAAHAERLSAYEGMFDAVVAEEKQLIDLYAPLAAQISDDKRLGKLSFRVNRVVDLAQWVSRGESILDLRKQIFGRGGLERIATKELQAAWQAGTPKDARSAMEQFLRKHITDLHGALLQHRRPHELGAWLFSTDHIAVRYGIQYDGVEVQQLSPGTKGVVLLMLYLALDKWDTRPLVIDQPEENLDPRSVFEELVPFFRDAASRRQIIMVTHNANLVVNTDSDQVIVASAERLKPDQLPRISYVAGGLESRAIREEICTILEGGQAAFRLRGRRYGIITP